MYLFFIYFYKEEMPINYMKYDQTKQQQLRASSGVSQKVVKKRGASNVRTDKSSA